MAYTYIRVRLESILTRFFGYFVSSAIGPLTDHPLISSPTRDEYISA